VDKNIPSEKSKTEKSKTIVEALILFSSYILLYIYISYIKTPVDGMTQDYPSVGLRFFSDWLPLFIPFPSTIYLLWREFSWSRRPLKLIAVIAVLLAIIGIYRVFSSEDISWDMSKDIFVSYIVIIGISAFLYCGGTKKRLIDFVEWILRKS
jgi:hypothetical protein